MNGHRTRPCWISPLWAQWTFKTSVKVNAEVQVSFRMGWNSFKILSFANCFRPRSNALPKSAAPVRWRGAPSLILIQIAHDKEAGAHQKREIQCFCTWAACTLKKRLTLEKLGSYWSAGQSENVRTQQAAHVCVAEITVRNFRVITERSGCLNIYLVQYAETQLCCVGNWILTW